MTRNEWNEHAVGSTLSRIALVVALFGATDWPWYRNIAVALVIIAATHLLARLAPQ